MNCYKTNTVIFDLKNFLKNYYFNSFQKYPNKEVILIIFENKLLRKLRKTI